MNGQILPNGMWLPGNRKNDGGSYFDDELESAEDVYLREAARLAEHLNERPDHVVHVGSAKEREQLRTVFNYWMSKGLIGGHPTIKIDYGVPEGAIRVDEDRG